MKTTIFTFFLSFCASLTFAQIDRSVQPTPGPAPTINIEKPYTFKLDNGLKVMVVENHKLPKVSMTLTIDNSPIVEGDKAGVSLTGDMLGTGTVEISKDDFNEKVDYLGASIWYGSQSAGANSLSKYFPEILELLADGAINPVFSQEEFDKKKTQLIEGIKSGEKNVAVIQRRVSSALAFGLDHPYGEFISEESINNVQLNDVITFYNTYFKPENAYLVIVGDVDGKATKKLVKEYFSDWKAEKVPQYAYSAPKDVQYSQINFIDMPNAVQSEIEVTNMVDLKISVTASVRRLNIDEYLPYSKGDVQTLNVQYGQADVEGVDYSFFKYWLEARFYFPVEKFFRDFFETSFGQNADRPVIFAARIIAGSSSGDVPYEQMYTVGGDTTLRGYDDDRYHGEDMLLGNFELRLPVDKNFTLVGFYDVGRAWRKNSDDSSFGSDMGSSPGFGVRINTPLGNLRLDYATGDEGRFHFGFGELF